MSARLAEKAGTGRETRPSRGVSRAGAMRSRKAASTWICAVIVLACCVVYVQTLWHDFVNYDDAAYVTENPMVQGGLNWAGVVWAFTTDRAMYIHPLTWLSHMADCTLYGMRPWGHHLTSVILHAIDSVLLFLVLRLMTRRLWPCAFVAALFAVHPLHVESVAWIAERKDVLSMLFWIGTLGAYTWYRRRPGGGRYLLVALLFLLGLLSKPMVVTLPFVLLLLDYWPLEQAGGGLSRRDMAGKGVWLVLEKTPLFLMTGFFSVVTFIMQARGNNLAFGEKVPFADRCANAAVVYVLYLAKTVWPSGLAAYYPHPIARPWWQVAAAVAILVAVTVLCLRRARSRPYLIVGWLWYLGTLVPVIELVQAGTFSHADRYTYIPLIGIFIMAAWGGADLAASWRVAPRYVAMLSAAVVVIFTICASVQTRYWRDSETLFARAIAAGQKSGVAYNNLAIVAMDQRRYPEARAFLKQALDCDPKSALTLNNLGKLAMDERRYDDARSYLGKALEAEPNHTNTLYNMGVLNMEQQRYEEAEMYLTRALDRDPEYINIVNNLGVVCANQGRMDEAERYFERALGLNPNNAGTLNNLGQLAMDRGRYESAEKYLRKALDIDHGNIQALKNLGEVLVKLGNQAEADGVFKRTQALENNHGRLR